MINVLKDEELWIQACMDTPFRGQTHSMAKTAEEAFILPGNAVKSKEREPNGFPKYHGILVKYGDKCLVRGHGSPVSGKWIWVGSNSDYNLFWIVD
jgi:hypothetical protein